MITDQSQAIVWQADYQPFGTVSESVTILANNLRFAGQYYDEESGLHYNYFRDYDPTMGRYVQADPIGILKDFSNPQLQVAIARKRALIGTYDFALLNHIYGYANQNPITITDFFGLLSEKQVKKGLDILDKAGQATSFMDCFCSQGGDCYSCCNASPLSKIRGMSSIGFCEEMCITGDIKIPECGKDEDCDNKK